MERTRNVVTVFPFVDWDFIRQKAAAQKSSAPCFWSNISLSSKRHTTIVNNHTLPLSTATQKCKVTTNNQGGGKFSRKAHWVRLANSAFFLPPGPGPPDSTKQKVTYYFVRSISRWEWRQTIIVFLKGKIAVSIFCRLNTLCHFWRFWPSRLFNRDARKVHNLFRCGILPTLCI